jgi:hypothetical protein
MPCRARAGMRSRLQNDFSVYTLRPVRIGRPPKPDHLRRSEMLPIRLTVAEKDVMEAAARKFGVTVADMIREGVQLYIRKRGKDGSRKRKEKTKRS